MAAKKAAAVKTKSKRPGVAGKGNKATPTEVLIDDQPRLKEALAQEIFPTAAPEKLVIVPAPRPEEPPLPLPKKKRQKAAPAPKSAAQVAQLQAAVFDPEAVKAAFSNDTAGQPVLPKLEGPVLEVAADLISKLGELQATLKLPPKTGADAAPLWLDHVDELGDTFDTLSLKNKAMSIIATYAKGAGKSINETLVKAMEMAGITGKDNLGVSIGSLRAKHQTGKTVTTDLDGVFIYLVERGVNPQMLEDAREANTKTEPFAFVAFYNAVDQRAVNLAAHGATTEDAQ